MAKKQKNKKNLKKILASQISQPKQNRAVDRTIACSLTDKNMAHKPEPTDFYIYLLNEGIALKRRGRYEAAKEKYIEAIKIAPHKPLAYYNLGKLLYIQRHFDQAVNSYKKALEFGYDAKEAMRHLGHALLAKDENPEKLNLTTHYRATIDPDFWDDLQFSGGDREVRKLTQKEIQQHEAQCMRAAVTYMDSSIVGIEG